MPETLKAAPASIRQTDQQRSRLTRLLRTARNPALPLNLLLVLGSLAVLGSALAVAHVVAQDRARAVEQQWQHQALLARLFEDQVARELDAASFALQALAQALPTEGPPPDSWLTAARQALALQRTVREFALFDPDGRWLAGTQAAAAGMPANLALPKLPEQAQRSVLGRWTAGRYLSDPAPAAVPHGVGFVPLVLRVDRPQGSLRLIASLHSEGWAVSMRSALGAGGEKAQLIAFDGQRLAHSAAIKPDLSEAASVQNLMEAARPIGHAERLDAQGQVQLQSWRQVGQRALWVVVERSQASVHEAWWRSARGFVAGSAALPVLLTILLLLGLRRLRKHERERRRMLRSHLALVAQAGELSQVMRSVNELLFRTDESGRLVFMNSRAHPLFGREPEQLLGERLEDLFEPMPETEQWPLWSDSQSGHSRSARLRLRSGEEPVRQFDVTLVPIIDAQGAPGFAGCAVECTVQAMRQQQLQEQARFHASLVELSPLPTSLLDDNGCYLQVNAAWEALFARSREKVIGQPAANLQVSELAREHDRIDAALRHQGGQVRYETHFTPPDGRERRLLVIKRRLVEATASLPAILCTVVELEVDPAHRKARLAQVAAHLDALLRKARSWCGKDQEPSRADRLLWEEHLGLARNALQCLLSNEGEKQGSSTLAPTAVIDLLRASHAQAVTTLEGDVSPVRWQVPAEVALPCALDEAALGLLLPLLRRLFLLGLASNPAASALTVDVRQELAGHRLALSWSGEGPAPRLDAGEAAELASGLAAALGASLGVEVLSGAAWRITLHLAGAPAGSFA